MKAAATQIAFRYRPQDSAASMTATDHNHIKIFGVTHNERP